jgi:hypothetical protein
MTYAEKLRDPRWQKKRLEILQRDDWKCQLCGDKSNTLVIHHFFYENNLEPWEYPNKSLITYCENCHESEHAGTIKSLEYLNQSLKKLNFKSYDIGMLENFIKNYMVPPNSFWENYIHHDQKTPKDFPKVWLKTCLKKIDI